MLLNTMKVLLAGVCLLNLQQVASVSLPPGPWSECQLDCIFHGWIWNGKLSGGTFLTIPGIESYPMCQFLCAAIPDCQFFTHDEADNTCAIKNITKGEMKMEEKEGRRATSGPRCVVTDYDESVVLSGGIPTEPSGGIANGIDYEGADLRNYEV